MDGRRVLVAIACLLAGPSGVVASEFIPLADLPGGGGYSFPTAVSSDGRTVVGVSSTTGDGSGPFNSLVWRDPLWQVSALGPTASDDGASRYATDVSATGAYYYSVNYGGWNSASSGTRCSQSGQRPHQQARSCCSCCRSNGSVRRAPFLANDVGRVAGRRKPTGLIRRDDASRATNGLRNDRAPTRL